MGLGAKQIARWALGCVLLVGCGESAVTPLVVRVQSLASSGLVMRRAVGAHEQHLVFLLRDTDQHLIHPGDNLGDWIVRLEGDNPTLAEEQVSFEAPKVYPSPDVACSVEALEFDPCPAPALAAAAFECEPHPRAGSV
jgi:hypothetical protein